MSHFDGGDAIAFVGGIEGTVERDDRLSVAVQNLQDSLFEPVDFRRRAAIFAPLTAIGRFDHVFARQGIGRRFNDVFRRDDAVQPAGKRFQQDATSVGRVVVGLVEDQQNRLMTSGQFDQGRVFQLIEIGIGDKQDQIGPGGRVAGHFAALGSFDFVDAGGVD